MEGCGGYSTRQKIEAFSHQGLNLPRFTSEELIRERVAQGRDLFDRPGFEWAFVPLDHTFPEIVLRNQTPFEHLIEPVPPASFPAVPGGSSRGAHAQHVVRAEER